MMNYKIKPRGIICHRLPERSFFFRGHQFPVCARCTGFYIGFFSCILFKYFGLIPKFSFNLIIAAMLATPLIFDGVTQALGLRESNNALRFVTGIMFGLFMLFV